MKKTKAPSRKKNAPDKIESLVRKHLANIATAEDTFKSASTLLEKYKTKYTELEQYVKNVSPSDRSLQIVDDVKDSRKTYHTFKIAVTGVATAYEITYPEQEDHSNVDQGAWISKFEEALAKAIAQIILARQSESASK
jgi:hypothetical protein